MSDNFLLTRNGHQSSLAAGIQEETEFQDVILACEDHQVRAHKIVLATSSPKLRNILLAFPQFIYTGEIAISPDQVKSFLDVAQDLEVAGLTDITVSEVSVNTKNVSSLGGRLRASLKPSARSATTTTRKFEKEAEEILQLSGATGMDQDTLTVVEQSEDEEDDYNYNTFNEEEVEEEEAVKRFGFENMNNEDQRRDQTEEKKFCCPLCPQKFFINSHLQRHIQAVHFGHRPHKCPLCDQAFGQSGNLKVHLQTVHSAERPHQCPDCNRAFSYRSHLTRHLKKRHQK